MSSKLALLFVLVASVSAGTCPAKIQCTQGVDTVNGIKFNVHAWNADQERHEWHAVNATTNNRLCGISFTPECEIQMWGIQLVSPPKTDSGCEYDIHDKVVYCICRDSHFCNMAPEFFAPSALAAYRAANIEISHNCPASFTPPAEFIPPTAC